MDEEHRMREVKGLEDSGPMLGKTNGLPNSVRENHAERAEAVKPLKWEKGC
jgi:hypothetical protein